MTHRARKFIALADPHIPYHDEAAMEIASRVVEHVKPELVVVLGDVLDCTQFSTHPPVWGLDETDFEDDTETANKWLDRLQKACGRLVMLEGNHENRIHLWAAQTREGRGARKSLAPRRRLSAGRTNFLYIPYNNLDGQYPHYKVNHRICAVHGWSYAQNATKRHLDLSQGKSILHGHTHRGDMVPRQQVWAKGIIQARSCGCLCRRVPLYGVGSPVDWVNMLVLGYMGRRSDTMYSILFEEDRCILPDGKEIAA